jgi:hypothetical protein
MTGSQIFWAFALSTLGGQLILAPVMELVRRLLVERPRRNWPVSFAVGMTERAVTTALVLWAPGYVAPFVGGWTVVKFAAGWGRITSERPSVRVGHVMALVGTTWSFAIAISVALWFHPDSVAYFLTAKSN